MCTPQWDGLESMDSYLRVLRLCYGAFCDRFEARAPRNRLTGKPQRYDLERADYVVFHAPFNRLTRKAVATLAHADRLRCLASCPAAALDPQGQPCRCSSWASHLAQCAQRPQLHIIPHAPSSPTATERRWSGAG